MRARAYRHTAAQLRMRKRHNQREIRNEGNRFVHAGKLICLLKGSKVQRGYNSIAIGTKLSNVFFECLFFSSSKTPNSRLVVAFSAGIITK